MQKAEKQGEVYITRKRSLTALGAVLWAAFAAGLVVLVVLAAKKSPFPSEPLKIGVCVATAVFATIGLINCGLCCRNLFYPYAIVFDENGIYDRTGFVHCGFVRWEDISGVDVNGAVMDFMLEDGAPTVRLMVKLPKKTFANRNVFFKIAYVLTQSPCVKLRTLCVNIKKQELAALLRERLSNVDVSGGDVE